MTNDRKDLRKARATPLASIFGSGFLVIVPILYAAVGPYSVVAMVGVCALAYAMGSVIRFNIRHAEPLLAAGTISDRTARHERTANLALVLAYAISVSLYIHILAAFLLGGLGINTPRQREHRLRNHHRGDRRRGAVPRARYTPEPGAWGPNCHRGTHSVADSRLCSVRLAGHPNHTLQWPVVPKQDLWTVLTVLGGTLIVVQGFETSRYLGSEFDAELRVRSCRSSQIVSTIIYVLFVAVATPLMHFLGNQVQDNGLLLLAAKASVLLPIPLVIAAVLSQFSAAVADVVAGGGNTAESTQGRVDDRHAYVLICGIAVVLAFASTLTILSFASRAFAFYYFLQCLVAISVSKSTAQKVAISLLAAALAFITLFAVPAG